jgi:hypothetical protein
LDKKKGVVAEENKKRNYLCEKNGERPNLNWSYLLGRGVQDATQSIGNDSKTEATKEQSAQRA